MGSTKIRFAIAVAILATQVSAPSRAEDREPAENVIFSINVQDFSYPDRSARTVERILDIHERAGVPVDFYLTGTIVAAYESIAPELLERLRKSTVASVSYHVRPPCPYYLRYDWMGLAEMDEAERSRVVREYETHGLDLATGEPTREEGGYAHLAKVLGYTPVSASLQSDVSLGDAVQSVFVDLGMRMMAVHGSRCINLGDKRNGTWLRPEHQDLKLFQSPGGQASQLIDDALAQARRTAGARAPYFVGIKMHDNDFFAEDSAWVTVYTRGRRKPPFDTNRRSALLSESDQEAMWKLYEAAVAHVLRERDRIGATNAPRLLARLDGPSAPARSESAKTTQLYVSGTMHIETRPDKWPDPDSLVAFFERATRAGSGMRWSIGADIGWLTREPRAGEVIRKTEALDVQWDVHAHALADRAACAAAIRRLGGHPTAVASGFLVRDLEEYQKPLSSSRGDVWQAEVLWGGANRPGHGQGADLDLIGVWRPKSSEAFTTHDPDGSLIDVSGGPLGLAEIETLARELAGTRGGAPVLSASIMVAPSTLTLVGTTDGIDQIEALADRLSALSHVHWASIEETARAWVEAGGVPSVRSTNGDGAKSRPGRPRRR